MNRKNKFLILAIPLMLVLTAGVIYQYGFIGIQEEMRSVNDIKAAKIKTLQKYLEAIAQKTTLEKQIVALKEVRKNEEAKIMTAQTPAIATATLQDSVKAIITGKGGTINSEKVEKTEDLKPFKITSVVLDVNFPDVRAVSDTLFAIETQTPYLVVKELDIRLKNFNNPKDLSVKMKIAALISGQ